MTSIRETVEKMERIIPANLEGDELWRRNAEYVRADEAIVLIERLAGALEELLMCPAIADGNLMSDEWGCPESAAAESKARAALSGEPAP